MTEKCRECGLPALFSKAYCSPECRNKRDKAYKRAYQKTDKYKAYLKAYHQKNKVRRILARLK